MFVMLKFDDTADATKLDRNRPGAGRFNARFGDALGIMFVAADRKLTI